MDTPAVETPAREVPSAPLPQPDDLALLNILQEGIDALPVLQEEPPQPQDVKIRVIAWKTVQDDYEVYTLHVNDGVFEWELLKRFSECFHLHEQLEKKGIGLPTFPPRKMNFFMDDSDRNERLKGLDHYFHSLSPAACKTETVKEFVGLNRDLNKRPILQTNRIRLVPPEEIVHLIRQICQTTPVIYLSSSEEMFLGSLLTDAFQLIQELNGIKENLDVLYGAHSRISFLQNSQERRSMIASQLSYLHTTLATLTLDPVIQTSVEIQQVLGSLLFCASKLVRWNATIDQMVMRELESGNNLISRMQEYQFEAETKLTFLVMNCDSDASLKKTEHDIAVLHKKIQEEIKAQLKLNGGVMSEAISKLETIENYLVNGLKEFKKTRNTKSPAELIAEYEASLFYLLDFVGKLDDDSDTKLFVEAKTSIDTLRKSLAALRIRLEKEAKESPQDPQLKLQADRVEEMQANMGDLTFLFGEKCDLSDFASRVHQDALIKQQKARTDQYDDL